MKRKPAVERDSGDNPSKVSKTNFIHSFFRINLKRTKVIRALSNFNFLDELERILAETADLHDKEAVAEMFEATDSNHDGRITFLEFVKMMKE